MSCHSSIVEMHLHVAGQSFEVAQSGGDFLILVDPARFSASSAELDVSIDGVKKSYPLRISEDVNGIRVETKVISTQKATQMVAEP